MIIFLGDITKEDLARFKKKEKKKRSKIAGYRDIVLAGMVGERTLRSGLPRALGVRLESHSTSRKNARNILRNGGYLDPNRSGKGAQQVFDLFPDSPEFKEFRSRQKASRGKVFITGVHPDEPAAIRRNGAVVAVNDPLQNVLRRQATRQQYRLYSGIDYSKIKDFAQLQKARQIEALKASLIPGYDLSKGRTLYIGGSDNFYRHNFIPDVDDVAMMTDKKIKVHGSRLGASVEAIRREGLLNLIKQNKSRVAVGIGILGVGGALAHNRIKSAINNLSDKEKVKVKDFYRRGKLIRGFLRSSKKKKK